MINIQYKACGMNKLILANPGVGKTATLANRVIELLNEGADPKEILCVTFIEKAANEMGLRIREFAERAKIDVKLHELSIRAFHIPHTSRMIPLQFWVF